MMHHDVAGDNRDPNAVVIPSTMKDPYDDLVAIVNRKKNSEAINRIVSKEEGIDGEAIPLGKLSDMKLK
jgi:hypothetical protein